MKKSIVLIVSAIAAIMLAGCGGKEANDTLTVINYGEYIDPDVLDDFPSETGIEIKYEEALTPEELNTMYKSGAII